MLDDIQKDGKLLKDEVYALISVFAEKHNCEVDYRAESTWNKKFRAMFGKGKLRIKGKGYKLEV